MTIEELIKELKQYPMNSKVYMKYFVDDEDGGHDEYTEGVSTYYKKFDNIWPQGIDIDGVVIEIE